VTDCAGTENYTVDVLERLKATGSRDAIVAGARRISGTEAFGALRFAAALREARLTDGDGVALFVQNSPEALLLKLAVHFAGCRLVFVPPEPGNSELEAFIQRAGVKALLVDPVFEERTRRINRGRESAEVHSNGISCGFATEISGSSNGETTVIEASATYGSYRHG
jgi:fatty-acyl-CoA synthase